MTSEYRRPVAAARSLRLHLNENAAGASPRVVEALRALDRREAGMYPDYDAAYAAASGCFGVPPEYLVLTNGLDEGILAVTASAFRERRGDRAEAVGVSPAFDMYEICTRAMGGVFVSIPLDRSFALPFDAMRAAAGPATRIVFLTNPHNPSGVSAPLDKVRALARDIAPAILFVDEAYAEFSGLTLIERATFDAAPNLVVGRTFSKAYGLAGLRVGAVIGTPGMMKGLREILPPYSVNAWAAAALPVAIADSSYRDWYIAQAAESRALLAAACERHGLRTWPSAANFVLIDFGGRARQIAEAMAQLGFAVRDKSAEPACHGCVRVTAGLVDDTRLFIGALEELLCGVRP